MPSLGLLLPEDHPASAAAYADPRNWPLALLMEGRPYTAPPAEYVCPGVPPASLDQNGIGACVAFSGVHIKTIEEKVDQGAWLYDNPSAFRAYDRLKHGWGAWPGDGIDAEGSIPQAFWEMARKVGVEDRNGRAWRISAWYSHSLASSDDDAFIQQVLMAYGPVSFGTAWPGNWFGEPKAANDWVMPSPSTGVSGHAYTLIGWKTIGGVLYWTFMNSWGAWGNPQGLFRARASWFHAAPLGPQIVHKVVDYDDVPDPPAPPPAGGDIVTAYDAIPRKLDSHVGAQIYKGDGTTPLVKISSGALNLYSPCKFSATDYVVRVSTGGVAQLGVLRGADATNIRPYTDCTVPVAAERKRWTDWLTTFPK